MTLDQLVTFRTVATLRSFGRAATTLHLTQPAVSKQICALERELCRRLFERSRPIRLTDSGELLLRRATQIIDALQTAREELGVQPPEPRRVTLGVAHSVAVDGLTRLLKTFCAQRADVDLHLEVAWGVEILANVRRGSVDLGLVMAFDEERDVLGDLAAIPLRKVDLAFVQPRRRPFVRSRSVELADLRGVPWVLHHPICPFRALIERLHAAHGIPLHVAVEVMGLQAQRELTVLGLGVTLLPLSMVASDLRACRLGRFRIRGVTPRVHIYAVHRQDRPVHSAIRYFLAMLAAHPRSPRVQLNPAATG